MEIQKYKEGKSLVKLNNTLQHNGFRFRIHISSKVFRVIQTRITEKLSEIYTKTADSCKVYAIKLLDYTQVKISLIPVKIKSYNTIPHI